MISSDLTKAREPSRTAADARALRGTDRSEPSAPPHAPESAASASPNSALTGATYVVRELERRVEVVAGIPGGAILPLYDALAGSSIRHVLARHEQGAAFIAQGMARATGKAAVCLATSGPGVTNLVTALADARADSVPLVAITAQVPRALIGTDAFQEVDTCALARPVTKACFFVQNARELMWLLPLAFELAEGGRPGPVLLDIPKDVLNEVIGDAGAAPERAPPSPYTPLGRPEPRVARLLEAERKGTWRALAEALSRSERPLLYIGGGIHMSGAQAPLLELARRADVPVVCSLHGLGSFPPGEPLFLGMLGMHGAPFVNHATEEADFVLAIGARFDDRATGKPDQFCRNARIAHVDVDAREIGKIKPVEIGVVADARLALHELLKQVAPISHFAWRERVRELRARHPLELEGEACGFLRRLAAQLDQGTIVTTDVGQHQMWVAQCLPFHEPRTLLTSGGLGTMGFGLPAAIGAGLARPGAQVVCVSGDGSFAMNVQELATLAELDLNVVVFVLNNGQLGLVRQQQELFYGRRYHAAHFQRGSNLAAIAAAYGIRAERAGAEELTPTRIARIFAQGGPAVVDVVLAGHENVLPMVPPGKSNIEMILGAGSRACEPAMAGDCR